MELRCNNCNEILEEFGCDYDARVMSCYSYNKETCKYELMSQELDNEANSHIYCVKCGKTLSQEILDILEF